MHSIETRPCPKCSARMIRTPTGAVFNTYPAKHEMIWWCACGHTEPAGTWTEPTPEERRRAEWDAANGPPPWLCGAAVPGD